MDGEQNQIKSYGTGMVDTFNHVNVPESVKFWLKLTPVAGDCLSSLMTDWAANTTYRRDSIDPGPLTDQIPENQEKKDSDFIHRVNFAIAGFVPDVHQRCMDCSLHCIKKKSHG